MNIKQIEALIAIGNGEGLSGAAEKLNVSQPAISKNLTNIETELGVSIFDRSKYRIELNQHGVAAYRRAIAIKAEIDAMNDELKNINQHTTDIVRLDCSPAAMPTLVPETIFNVRKKYPYADVRLIGTPAEDPVIKQAKLNRGKSDLLVTHISAAEREDWANYEHLVDIHLVFMTHKSHPSAKLKSPTLKELSQYDWITPGPTGPPHFLLKQAFNEANAQMPSNILALPYRGVAISMLLLGGYIVAIPMHKGCIELNLDDLHILDVKTRPLKWDLSIITRKNSVLSPATEYFRNSILKAARHYEEQEH